MLLAPRVRQGVGHNMAPACGDMVGGLPDGLQGREGSLFAFASASQSFEWLSLWTSWHPVQPPVRLLGGIRGDNLILACNHKVNVQ